LGRYLLRKLAGHLILVLIAACVTYFLAATSLDPRSGFTGRNPAPSPSAVTAILNAYNLNPDTPVVVRFARWARGVLHGDLGRTVAGGQVDDEFRRRVAVSVRLLVAATVLGSVGGVFLGAWSAARQYRAGDRAATLLSFFVLAMPVFVTAVTLQLWARDFNQALGFTVIEYIGEFSPDAKGTWAVLLSRLRHLLLPSVVLIIVEVALFSRYQRSTMLDVLDSDFLRTARAKGLSRRTAQIRHGLRIAVLPVVPLLVYNTLLVFTGAAFIEKIFGWHGMGEWLIDSITTDDVNAVAAVGLFTAVLVLIAGLLSDLLYAALDPRVRLR